jgi:hypothetical protein
MPQVSPKNLSRNAPLRLAILDQPNLDPSSGGTFILTNMGSAPVVGTLYIDANPGQLSAPINYVYEQVDDARHVRGKLPDATFEAEFRSIKVPKPHPFREIVDVMNESQLLQLGPNDKGVCIVPASRRTAVLRFLGFGVK